jgi:hypothetical protein
LYLGFFAVWVFAVWVVGGGCPLCPSLGDGHFGHVRFKKFLFFEFDGHLGCWIELLDGLAGWRRLIDLKFVGT